jgi:predicted RNA polymerase sigma factor
LVTGKKIHTHILKEKDVVDLLLILFGVETGILDRYHLFHSVRGDLLSKVGRHAEARDEFELAASLTDNLSERELCRRRADAAAEALSAL